MGLCYKSVNVVNVAKVVWAVTGVDGVVHNDISSYLHMISYSGAYTLLSMVLLLYKHMPLFMYANVISPSYIIALYKHRMLLLM